MATLEHLPADQRAVLQLVLQRGRGYDEIARLLSMDRAAVRERALNAFDALGPQTGVGDQRRALITDYLLGQLPRAVNDQVRDHLAQSPSERAWARVLAAELAPLANHPLPEIPTEATRAQAPVAAPPAAAPSPAQREEPAAPEKKQRESVLLRRRRAKQAASAAAPAAGAAGAGAAAAASAPAPAAPSSPEKKQRESVLLRRRRRKQAAKAAGPTAAGSRIAAATGSAPPTEPAPATAASGADGERRSSRLGGAILLLLGLLIAVAVVVFIVNRSSNGTPHKAVSAPATSSTTPAAASGTTTATTSGGAKVVAQVNLTPTAKNSKAAGIAEVLKEGANDGIAIVAQNVPPNSTKPPNAYAVWLYNSDSDAHFLGFVNPGVGANGKLSTAGGLPANASHYKQLVVTVETIAHPKTPGPIILSGALTGL